MLPHLHQRNKYGLIKVPDRTIIINMLSIKRAYEHPAPSDGTRILVDRLWPRGLTKEKASIDTWLKDIAPSKDLRIWFGHKPERFAEFSRKYIDELRKNPAVATLEELMAQTPNTTLVYAAKDPEINHAVVLKKFLETKTGAQGQSAKMF